MAVGYERKIHNIVDTIVSDNVEFKLKSSSQQDIEKADMVKNINLAISGLNDYGLKLVLTELDKEAKEKAINIFDTTGSVNLTELTKFTATLVTSTVEKYKELGIDLNSNAVNMYNNNNVEKNATEILLIAPLVNKMNKDFNSLSNAEITQLINGYSELSDKDKEALFKGYKDKIESDKSLPQVAKDEILKKIEEVQIFQKIRNVLKENKIKEITDENIEDIISQVISKSGEISEAEKKKIREMCERQKGRTEEELAKKEEELAKDTNKMELVFRALNELKIDLNNITSKNENEVIAKIKEYSNNSISEYFIKQMINSKFIKEKIKNGDKEVIDIEAPAQEEQSASPTTEDDKRRQEEQAKKEETAEVEEPTSRQDDSNRPTVTNEQLENTEFFEEAELYEENEIINISQLLSKENYSNQEIAEAFKTFKDVFESLDEDDLKDLGEKDSDYRKEILLDVFEENFKEQMNPRAYDALVNMVGKISDDYLNNLIQNPQLIQESLLPSLSVEVEKLIQEPINDEHVKESINNGNIVEETLDASAAIEAQQEHTTEENGKQAQAEQLKEERTESYAADNSTDTSGSSDNNVTGNAHKVADIGAMMAFLGNTVTTGQLNETVREAIDSVEIGETEKSVGNGETEKDKKENEGDLIQ